ncbi:cell division protein FtsW (lipid II flippase) [Lachnospiraceae bacterium PF1-21]|uniref:Rod shape-determining protein RodA n=1 Tax=Ohessyouella blattaphilus TaxID=2949333 RepID=A0ABT1EEZ3_9FIRM|nr:FtsW/RodA/SpoVE family cell cycle protein [Ohessyouella blattaphilus]MCP1109213.1 rod shape-determining protein RodA [Ohessyouella blattaphilus]MCR8562607.1 rod shape-determining protein RodA [Ohessyouella blattaphilus]
MKSLKKTFRRLTKAYDFRNYNFILIICVLILSAIGIMAVGSARPSLQLRQLVGVCLGVVGMTIMSLISYKWITKFYWIIYGVTNVALVLVLLFGNVVNGARRWIDVGPITIQPSELAKLFLIIFVSTYITKYRERLNTWPVLGGLGILILVPAFLIYKEPSMSSTITVLLIVMAIVFVGGLSYKIIGGAFLVIIPLAVIFLSIVVREDQKLIEPYQRNRIMAFFEPEEYATDTAYQQNNSVIAIGSGQLTGKGLNSNTTASVKNGNFIAEPQTDFIFAIIGEELGFVGCMLIIALVIICVIQCIRIGLKSPDFTGKLICAGVGAWIGLQSFINIGVATQVLPNTGVPLPFVSYGLSSVVSLFAGVGMVLNVGLQVGNYSKRGLVLKK